MFFAPRKRRRGARHRKCGATISAGVFTWRTRLFIRKASPSLPCTGINPTIPTKLLAPRRRARESFTRWRFPFLAGFRRSVRLCTSLILFRSTRRTEARYLRWDFRTTCTLWRRHRRDRFRFVTGGTTDGIRPSCCTGFFSKDCSGSRLTSSIWQQAVHWPNSFPP